MNDNIEAAVNLLAKGKKKSINTLLYNFSHGVIMFRLGLLKEALEDFSKVTRENPKEKLAVFNTGLTLF